MKTIEAYSPNVSQRKKDQLVTTVVIHYTGSDNGSGAVAHFSHKTPNPVSAHVVIDRDGTVYKCAKLGSDDSPGQTAWHAGTSKGPDGYGVNSYSLGVELAGTGTGFTEEQYGSLIQWINEVKHSFKHLKWITGHSDVCTPKGRKADPGPNFDMNRVAEATSLTIWRRK